MRGGLSGDPCVGRGFMMAQRKTSVERREKGLLPVLFRVTVANRQDRAALSQPADLQEVAPVYGSSFLSFPYLFKAYSFGFP